MIRFARHRILKWIRVNIFTSLKIRILHLTMMGILTGIVLIIKVIRINFWA